MNPPVETRTQFIFESVRSDCQISAVCVLLICKIWINCRIHPPSWKFHPDHQSPPPRPHYPTFLHSFQLRHLNHTDPFLLPPSFSTSTLFREHFNTIARPNCSLLRFSLGSVLYFPVEIKNMNFLKRYMSRQCCVIYFSVDAGPDLAAKNQLAISC
jgi:hypothetical protein